MRRTYYFRSQYGTVYKTDDPDGAPFNHWGDPPVRIKKDEYILDRIEEIKQYVKEGDTLYTDVQSVSRSGMSRHIRVYAIRENEPINLSPFVADILGRRYLDKDNSVMVGGCGMDMGFEVVYSLSYALFEDGYTLNQKWM